MLRLNAWICRWRNRSRICLIACAACMGAGNAPAQTSSTGAVTGVVFDPSGAVTSGALVHLLRSDETEVTAFTSDQKGQFAFLLLPPGTYQIRANRTGFESYVLTGVRVSVTETLRLELHLRLAAHSERQEVSSNPLMVQLDSSTLGRVANEQVVRGLPLATRNFAQIAVLSPGVVAGVYNAGELGAGGSALAQIGKSNDGIYVHGARSYDNNWQLDGVSVSDVLGSGATSGGIPTPNPDAVQEFKMQTSLYDASFGRATGGVISVVTKEGGTDYHGTLFEFLRNDVFNANDFFLNETGQKRQSLKQNQFGLTIGGPVVKEKAFFFGSYQGTRQVNGVAAGQARVACSASLNSPPLTDDRSPEAIGQLFAGRKGQLGGVAVNSDGSNINPAALALLNFKLPDGSFLVPTPQVVDTSKPFASQGFSVFTEPCRFDEDQFLLNFDYVISPNSRLTSRFFAADDNQIVSFPGNGLNFSGNTPGFSGPSHSRFVVFTMTHTYTLNSKGVNQAEFGFVRTSTTTGAQAPFSWSDVGVAEGEMNEANALPSLNILGSLSMAPAFPRTYTQNSIAVNDTLSLLKGPHVLKLGGSLTRLIVPLSFQGAGSFVQFLSWPDFLLGLNSAGNGTGTFSNVFASADIFGLLDRNFTAWEFSGYVQDDYHVRRSLTVNLGLRYERPGQFGDNLGRHSSFDFSRADANPPPAGSLDGYIVASNFPGTLPKGVIRVNNTFGTYADGQNTIAPRVGFAWQILPQTTRVLLRGGYGIYYSRPTGQAFTQSVIAAPFSLTRISTGLANASATFQTPFAQPFPTPDSFPLFVPYSPTTSSAVNALAPDFRPAMVQRISLNVQAELLRGWLLEIGYAGSRGAHLQRFRSLNQAQNATPSAPVRGLTSNTLANISLRVPISGMRPDALREMESAGSSWYNGLEVSLTKRLSQGIQFLASYTFSKTLDTDGSDINGTSAGNTLPLGDQNSPKQRWGRASIDRPQRFVFSTTWDLPNPRAGIKGKILGDWHLAAVATIQEGTALTIAYTNSNNVFGISQDRAQLSGKCAKNELVKAGRTASNLGNYFNASCFTNLPVIGADNMGTAFGNSGTGIVNGPGQANLDMAISKTIALAWPHEKSTVELRAEFFNAFNHPQFANPDTNFSSPTFGVISSTSVNARVGQVAVRFGF
jgi:hypothetical protein